MNTYLSIPKVCETLQVDGKKASRCFVLGLIYNGNLKAVKIGERIYSRQDWLEEVKPDDMKTKNDGNSLLINEDMDDFLKQSEEKWLAKSKKN